jgi:hypothetical protein
LDNDAGTQDMDVQIMQRYESRLELSSNTNNIRFGDLGAKL